MGPPTSHREPPPPPTVPGRRPDESMTLLTSMMERPLDPAYTTAAERRTAAGLPASTGTRTLTVLVAFLVTGLLLSASAVALRRPSSAITEARAELVSQIEQRRALADERAQLVQQLQAEVDEAQTIALGGGQSELADRLQRLALGTGSVPVTGPGVVITLDDAPSEGDGSADGDPRTQADADDGRVLARDLQLVTNGLWEAGAEAMAINGQRLTARSAIRFAGEAIIVNYRPLTRPYTISAIGDPASLQVEFAENPGGSYVRALTDNYGVRVTMEEVERLTLPGATSLTVRNAAPPSSVPTATTAPSTPTTTETSQPDQTPTETAP